MQETCLKAISMLEARQGGAGDSQGSMWKVGLWQEWKILQPRATTSVWIQYMNKLLWDFKIQTDNKVEHNKPDIVNVVLDKIERKCLIIDVACAFDIRVKGKEKEEI